jgi:hypothetical protein
MKKAAAPSILWALMLLAVPVIAEAQQTGKVFRIGFLDGSTASGIAVLLEAFRQEMSKLGWSEGKILPSSTGLQNKRMNACPTLPRT